MAKVGKIENRLTIQGVDNTAKAISSAQKGLKKVRDEAKGTQNELKKANKTTDDWLGKLTGGAFAYNEISEAAGRVGGQISSVAAFMDDAVKHTQMLTLAFGDLDTAYETAAATGFAFSMEGLAQGVNMLKRANVPIQLTGDQLEKISKLAISMGIDGNEGLTKFAEAIAKGETASLEQLGIFIKSEEVIGNYAKKHNIATGALTQHTKQMIVAKAALKELDAAQVSTNANADAWEQSTNKLDTAWSAFKSNVIAPVAGGVAEVLAWVTPGSISSMEKGSAVAIEIGQSLQGHLKALDSINNLIDERAKKARDAAKANLDMQASETGLTGEPTYAALVAQVAKETKAASDTLKEFNTEVKTQEGVIKSAKNALENNVVKPISDAREAIKKTGDTFKKSLGAAAFKDVKFPDLFVGAEDTAGQVSFRLRELAGRLKITGSVIKESGQSWEVWQNFLGWLSQRREGDWLKAFADDAGQIVVPFSQLRRVLPRLKGEIDAFGEQYGRSVIAERGDIDLQNAQGLYDFLQKNVNLVQRLADQNKANAQVVLSLEEKRGQAVENVEKAEKQLSTQKKAQATAQARYNKALETGELKIRAKILSVMQKSMTAAKSVADGMISWLKRTDISIKGVNRAKIINTLTKSRFELEKVIAKIQLEKDRAAIRAQIQILKARQKALKLTLSAANAEMLRQGTAEARAKAEALWTGKAGQELRKSFGAIATMQKALKQIDQFEAVIDASKYRKPSKSKGTSTAPSLPDAIGEKFIKEQQVARLKAKAAMTNEDKKRVILLEFEIKALTHIAQKEKELLMLKKAGSKHAHLRADVQKRFAHQMMTAEVQKEQALQKLRAEGFKSIESGIAKMNAASKAQLDKLRAEAEAERQSRLEKMREFNDLMFGMSQDLNQRLAEAHGMTIEDADGKTQSVLDNTQKGVLKAAGAMQSVAVLTKKLINENGKLQDGMITALGSSLAAFFEHEHERSAFMAGMVMLDAIAATIRTQNYAYLALGAAAAAGYGALAGVQYSAHKKEEAAKARAESMKAASVKPIKAAGGEAMGGAITYVFNAPVIGGTAQELSAQMSGMQADGSGSGFAGGGI